MTRTLLIASSLHALIENLPLVASASKGGLTFALRQVTVTILNLTLVSVAQSRWLLTYWGLDGRGLLDNWRLLGGGRRLLNDWGLLDGASRK